MLMAPMAPSQGWDKGDTNEANTSGAEFKGVTQTLSKEDHF